MLHVQVFFSAHFDFDFSSSSSSYYYYKLCSYKLYTSSGMGFGVQYLMNFTVPLPNNGPDIGSVRLGTSDSWSCASSSKAFSEEQSTAFNHLRKNMDRLNEHYCMDSLKKTMLKHEETFQQQVCELHRLYEVQRLLMAELRSRDKKHASSRTTSSFPAVKAVNFQSNQFSPTNSAFWISPFSLQTASPFTNHHIVAHESSIHHASHGFQFQVLQRELNSEEVSCSSRTQLNFSCLERPTDDNAYLNMPSVSQRLSMTAKSCVEDDRNHQSNCEIDFELTLSTGCSKGRKKDKRSFDLGCSESTSYETSKFMIISPKSGQSRSESSEKPVIADHQRFPALDTGREDQSSPWITPVREHRQKPPWLLLNST